MGKNFFEGFRNLKVDKKVAVKTHGLGFKGFQFYL